LWKVEVVNSVFTEVIEGLRLLIKDREEPILSVRHLALLYELLESLEVMIVLQIESESKGSIDFAHVDLLWLLAMISISIV